jgi:hypothetical protein
MLSTAGTAVTCSAEQSWLAQRNRPHAAAAAETPMKWGAAYNLFKAETASP